MKLCICFDKFDRKKTLRELEAVAAERWLIQKLEPLVPEGATLRLVFDGDTRLELCRPRGRLVWTVVVRIDPPYDASSKPTRRLVFEGREHSEFGRDFDELLAALRARSRPRAKKRKARQAP